MFSFWRKQLFILVPCQRYGINLNFSTSPFCCVMDYIMGFCLVGFFVLIWVFYTLFDIFRFIICMICI